MNHSIGMPWTTELNCHHSLPVHAHLDKRRHDWSIHLAKETAHLETNEQSHTCNDHWQTQKLQSEATRRQILCKYPNVPGETKPNPQGPNPEPVVWDWHLAITSFTLLNAPKEQVRRGSYLTPIFRQHNEAIVINQKAAEILNRDRKCLVCIDGGGNDRKFRNSQHSHSSEDTPPPRLNTDKNKNRNGSEVGSTSPYGTEHVQKFWIQLKTTKK